MIDAFRPSNVDLANFLGVLSTEGKATATIRVYRAAICTFLQQLAGPTFKEDWLLRDTLSGSSVSEALSPRKTPAWDLSIVVSFLKGPPFDPLRSADLKSLTHTCQVSRISRESPGFWALSKTPGGSQ